MAGYWNEINPKETKEIIQGDTFLNRAAAEADLLKTGRFAKETATQIVGAGAKYPEIKSGPWSAGDPGLPDAATDQLGYSIDEVIPVEERPTLPNSDDSLVHAVSPDAAAASSPWAAADGARLSVSPTSVAPQPSPPKFKRRI